MKVRFSPRAQRRVKVVAKWWRENRPSAPTLFEEELHDLIERLKSQPTMGLEYEHVGGRIVRRTLLAKSVAKRSDDAGVIAALSADEIPPTRGATASVPAVEEHPRSTR